VGKALQPPFVPVPPGSYPQTAEDRLRAQAAGYALFGAIWGALSALDLSRSKHDIFGYGFGAIALGWIVLALKRYRESRQDAHPKS